MEFTGGRRLVRRGRKTLGVAAAGVLAALVWLTAAPGGGLTGPLALLGLSLARLWRGHGELARSRRPFRLRVDDFGITLHDAELSWDQIDAVALHHPPLSDDESSPQPPVLVLWPAPGVTLPRTPDRGFGALPAALRAALPRPLPGAPAGPLARALSDQSATRQRYTLVRTQDLDQSVGELGAALARHGRARFETARRAVRPPTPLTVSGPELRARKPEFVFTDTPAGPARTARGVATRVCSPWPPSCCCRRPTSPSATECRSRRACSGRGSR